jgi:predicted permease
MRVLWSRVLGLLGHRHRDTDLDDDIQAHLELLLAKYVSDGSSEEAARAAARRDFGGIDQMREAYRDRRGVRWIDDAYRDCRGALRSLSRNRSFTAVVALTLGLGIAATTAVFSVVNAVILKPLNAPDGERIVRSISLSNGQLLDYSDAYTLKAWQELPAVFEDVSAHRLDSVNVTDGSEPEQVPVGRVSESFFRLFGAPILVGRTFTTEEDRPGGPPVAVLSASFWVRWFHGDRSVIGHTVRLGRTPYLIVGVIGAEFDSEQFEPRPELWLPLQADPDRVDGASIYQVTARLRPGVSRSAADAALAVQYARWRATRGARSNRPTGAWVALPVRQAMVGRVRLSLNLLLGAVIVLLLIACANVANLLLMRADGRRREMAVRAAIGAGRGRIARQLLIESLVLASIGGVVGLVTGSLATRLLLRLFPSSNPYMLGALGSIPRIGEGGAAVALDWRVFGWVALVSVSTGVVFGLLPLRQSGRTDLTAALQHRTAETRRRRRLTSRGLFVIGQLALSVILVTGAALLVRTSLALQRVDPGFRSDHVLTMRMAVTGTPFETRDGITELTRDGIERVESIPGVVRASTACCMPLETVWQLPFVMASRRGQGLTQAGGMQFHGFAGWTFVSPGYFEVFGVPILKGCDFSSTDTATAPGVAIINEAMARRYWPNSDPLADQLIIGRGMRPAYDQEPVRQIIGIVGNVRDTRITDPPRPAIYVPVAQEPDDVTILNVKLLPLVWIVRTAADPGTLSRSIQHALEAAPGHLPVTRIRTMSAVVSDSTARTTFDTWLMATFGVCAMVLAAVGVYGLIAYWVQQRKHEIGVRLALGAQPTSVARMVVAQGGRIALIGLAIGVVAALALAQVMQGLVFGVTPRDPLVFGAVVMLLASVAVLAVAIPARRATRIDPMQTLRAE